MKKNLKKYLTVSQLDSLTIEDLETLSSLQSSKLDNNEESLAKSYTQYIKRGNTFAPAGPVSLQNALASRPFEIQLMPDGPVFIRVKPLSDEILTFDDSPMSAVVKEIDKFWDRKNMYNKLGLMHNRGILLYGPPGTGKSICLQQVVELMAKRGDIVFFVKNPEAITIGMDAFRQIEPNRKVVICFEEADEMCRYNEREMLRMMDGDAKIEGVLFLATTNYIDRLPPRILRPGRFDRKIYVGYPTYKQRLKYLNHKLQNIGESPEKIKEIAKESEGLSFGHLRELIAGVYAIGDSLDKILKDLQEYKE